MDRTDKLSEISDAGVLRPVPSERQLDGEPAGPRRFGLDFQLMPSKHRHAMSQRHGPGGCPPERVVMAIGSWKTRSVLDSYNVVSERDLHGATAKHPLHLNEAEKARDKATFTFGRICCP